MGCACCRSKAETHARLLFPASIEKLGISPVLSILVKRFRKYDEGMVDKIRTFHKILTVLAYFMC